MRLCVDIGNTMSEFVFFDESGQVAKSFKTKSVPQRTYEEWRLSLRLDTKEEGIHSIQAAIISSVVPSLTHIIEKLILELFGVQAKTLGPGLKTGMRINTDNPKEVGADLIADGVGAFALYGGDCLIADLGTATKLIHINDKGAFEGCSIAPGLGLGLAALVNNTAALPEVSLQIPSKIIGKNTNDSMNSGLLYGCAYGLKAMADGVDKEVGRPLKRILTGGYAEFVKDLLPDFHYEPHLLAKGLFALLVKNGD